MLKGIKKTKLQQKKEVNSTQLKKHIIKQQQNDSMTNKTKEEIAKQCINAYFKGNVQQLKKLLTALQTSKQSPLQKKKFDYEINFQQTKQYKRPKPLYLSKKNQQDCYFCPQNQQIFIISASNFAYLAFAKKKTFLNHYHLIIAPVEHQPSSIGLDENIATQIMNFKKCLIQAFDKMNLVIIFFEQFTKENSHIYIECLPIPLQKAQELPLYFKQALDGIEGNWGTHKSVITISKNDLSKQIPKKIMYFYIDFSLGYGFAHAIENNKQWDKGFCYEILAAALGMQTYQVKTTQEYQKKQLFIKLQAFLKIWKPFDWTSML